MNELLAQVIDAHGGMNRWNRYEKVEATIVSGGGLFPLKGVVQDANPSRMTVWLHEERSSVFPYGAADQRTMFTPERIAIEKLDGSVVAERREARDSFAGHQMNTAWDALHRAYFIGEALWTYLTTPFLLAMDGVAVEETELWSEGEEAWRVLRAHFPGLIETHSLIQDFFFDESLTPAARLQRQHRRRSRGGATHIGPCGCQWHSPADEAPRLRAWTYSPTHLGNADGLDRYQRSQLLVGSQSTCT